MSGRLVGTGAQMNVDQGILHIAQLDMLLGALRTLLGTGSVHYVKAG